MKSLSAILASFCMSGFMSGCAGVIYNSDRPRFPGPILKPLWSVPELEISKTPLVHDGIVYVQPNNNGHTNLYAFDLKTGKQLWVAKFLCRDIKVVMGALLLAEDEEGKLHSLNSRSGEESGPPAAKSPLSAARIDDLLIGLFADRSVVAIDRPEHTLWTARVPMGNLFHPTSGGRNLYVYGHSKGENPDPTGCAIHAFDPATGALRWKWATDKCYGLEDNPMSAITTDADTVYLRIDTVQTDDKAGQVIAIDATTGGQRWTSPTVEFLDDVPMLVDANTVAVIDNIPGDHGGTANRKNPLVVRGLDRATGQVKWESRTTWKYPNWTYRDGLLFVADRMAHSLIGTGNNTSPDSFLTVVDLRTAKELWRSETVQLGSFTTPVIEDGIVVVGSLPFGDENPQAAGLFAFRATRDGK